MSILNRKEPRHEVVSLRLNKERFTLLDRYREALSSKLNRAVSIAEAAFLVIEDRVDPVAAFVERHELLQAPTAALARIRTRWTTQHTLTPEEWTFVAEYVHIAAEEARQGPPVEPSIPSRASYLALFDAFEAVYQRRVKHDSRHAWAYYDNLGGHETGLKLSTTDADQRHNVVSRLVALRRSQVADPQNALWYAGYLGRCFLLAVRDEGLNGPALDEALAPYWPTVWGLAARGHWFRHEHRPIRVVDGGASRALPLPEAQSAGTLSLSFVSLGEGEIAARVQCDGESGPSAFYVRGYPELMEFRALLEETPRDSWHGPNFASKITDKATGARVLWVKTEAEFRLSPERWTALRDLFRQAWDTPELQFSLRALRDEYGEHG